MTGALLPLYFVGGALLCWCMEVWSTRFLNHLYRRLKEKRFAVLGEIVAGQMDEIENMRRFSALDVRCTARITDPDGKGWTIIVEQDFEEVDA